MRRIILILLLIIPLIPYAEIIDPANEYCLSWDEHSMQAGDSTFRYWAYYMVNGVNRRKFSTGELTEVCFIASKVMDLSKEQQCFKVRCINSIGSGALSEAICILNKEDIPVRTAPAGTVTGMKIYKK